jgi:hypothetical protein
MADHPAEKHVRRRKRRPLGPLDKRLALRTDELAESLGVSERLLREKAHLIPHLHIGAALVFPLDAVRAWLTQQARVEASRADTLVESLRTRISAALNE